MNVSEVRLNLINSSTAVKAIGSFALDDAFAVRGVRVMEDKKGNHFVAFPSREKQDGSYEDIAFPLSKELYAEITGAILKEYKQMVEHFECLTPRFLSLTTILTHRDSIIVHRMQRILSSIHMQYEKQAWFHH